MWIHKLKEGCAKIYENNNKHATKSIILIGHFYNGSSLCEAAMLHDRNVLKIISTSGAYDKHTTSIWNSLFLIFNCMIAHSSSIIYCEFLWIKKMMVF